MPQSQSAARKQFGFLTELLRLWSLTSSYHSFRRAEYLDSLTLHIPARARIPQNPKSFRSWGKPWAALHLSRQTWVLSIHIQFESIRSCDWWASDSRDCVHIVHCVHIVQCFDVRAIFWKKSSTLLEQQQHWVHWSRKWFKIQPFISHGRKEYVRSSNCTL